MNRRLRNRLLAQGCDSQWEFKLRRGVLRNTVWKPRKINYESPVIRRTYQPDAVIDIQGKRIYIEAKGRFRTMDEAKKYIYVRSFLKRGEELVFLFMSPKAPLPGASMRKDGTRRSHAEWAEANEFLWFSEQSILTRLINKKDGI